MPRYNHLVTIAFSVISSDEMGRDLTPAMLCDALIERIRDLNRSSGGVEWLEAVEGPRDSFEETVSQPSPSSSPHHSEMVDR